jgi:hypothetical protein
MKPRVLAHVLGRMVKLENVGARLAGPTLVSLA